MFRVIGLLACAVGVAALVARFVDVSNRIVLLLAVGCPYLMLALPLGTAALLAIRHWITATCVGLVTLVAVATQLPLRPTPVREPNSLRIMSANTLEGFADAHTLVDLARSRADIVSVQELTPDELKRLSGQGIDTAFPHRITKPLTGGSGAGLWSRYPLTEAPRGEFEGLPIVARVDLPGGAATTAPTVAAVHLSAPWPWPIEWWRSDIARATATLTEMPAGPVIAVGDFNSTRDIAQFRRLMDSGFHKPGFVPTYPANRWFPPLLAIDHVLTRDCSASAVWTATVPGSDHRAVLATVQLPGG